MKALPWICVASLAGNLALGWHLSRRPAADPSPTPTLLAASTTAAPGTPQPSSPVAAGEGPAFVRADTALAKALDGSDLKAMRDALEASGLTEADAKAVIRTRIRESQKAAREAIDRRRSPAEDTWWYQDEEARQKFEEQKRADRRVLDEQVTQSLAALFGPEPKAAPRENIHQNARFLPADKALAVSRILQDYEQMEREARPRGYNGMQLPSDAERQRFIEAERRKDLEAVLSPEELRDYDLRHSQTARNLRWRLGGMKPTQKEYEAIYAATNEVETRFDLRGDHEQRPADFWQKRREAEAAAAERLRQQLGEKRYIDYAISNDHNARTVDVVVQRYGLAADTTRQLWSLRQQTGLEAKAVFDNAALSQDEKRARLGQLAQRSRRELDRLLAPEAQAELKQNNFVQWVSQLERNQVTIWNDTGNSSSGFSL